MCQQGGHLQIKNAAAPMGFDHNLRSSSKCRSMSERDVYDCKWERGSVCVVLIRNLLDSGGGNQREHLCGVPVAVLFATRKLESIQLLGA